MKDVIYLLIDLLSTLARPIKPVPKAPFQEVIKAIIEMKRLNPRYAFPRIAKQINLAIGLNLDSDVVRRILAMHCRPDPSN